jgi:UDPglucose--hexose-1-phosphate uridylyltransferase
MSEFRRDPFLGRWRIVAEGRSARPNEYAVPPAGAALDPNCPFCEGNEGRTPPELAAIRRPGSTSDTPGWSVRAIPNKFPTVAPSAAAAPPAEPAPFDRRPGAGQHEVIIESARHSPDLPYLAPDALHSLFRFLRERVRAAAGSPGVGAVLLFENRGPESGGTLPHPHAQLVATADAGPRLEEERRAFERGRDRGASGCPLEAVVEAERRDRRRVLADSRELTAFAPFASEYPYEFWIVPRRHASTFPDATDAEVDRLSELLPALLRALDRVRPRASYNWWVHGLANPTGDAGSFHWHLEVAPRLVRADAYELGSGVSVNPVPPEQAAAELRAAMAADAGPPSQQS